MNREDAVWYYRLGGQTLGPVSWAEIEQLLRDTAEGDRLLVARGGDEGWSRAADVMSQHPELRPEEPVPSAAAEEVIEEAGADDWALSDLDEPEPAPAAPVQQPRAVPTGGMRPQHGLGKWLGQAWEIVAGNLWAFVGAAYRWHFRDLADVAAG
ncbi:MAG: DUF4339 domain-containing protein [Armatimonadota bacterium]|nr:DUF4339 domain-containing protein [Armatimonadota bacterium]